jgi:hypothetical protein
VFHVQLDVGTLLTGPPAQIVGPISAADGADPFKSPTQKETQFPNFFAAHFQLHTRQIHRFITNFQLRFKHGDGVVQRRGPFRWPDEVYFIYRCVF